MGARKMKKTVSWGDFSCLGGKLWEIYVNNQHPSGILWNGMFGDFCEFSPLRMGRTAWSGTTHAYDAN